MQLVTLKTNKTESPDKTQASITPSKTKTKGPLDSVIKVIPKPTVESKESPPVKKSKDNVAQECENSEVKEVISMDIDESSRLHLALEDSQDSVMIVDEPVAEKDENKMIVDEKASSDKSKDDLNKAIDCASAPTPRTPKRAPLITLYSPNHKNSPNK